VLLTNSAIFVRLNCRFANKADLPEAITPKVLITHKGEKLV
jgi:hypothetical protein